LRISELSELGDSVMGDDETVVVVAGDDDIVDEDELDSDGGPR
jgi:hypothetical protein